MVRSTRVLGLAFASLTAAGCATVANAPAGVATQEFERQHGKPYRVWQEANGGASWEYPTGPEGKYTYMVRFDGSGRVSRVDQVLDDNWFANVRMGMGEGDIEHLLGRPFSKEQFSRVQQTVWAWRYRQVVWDRCFYVHFDPRGKVVTTSSRDEDRDSRWGRLARPC